MIVLHHTRHPFVIAALFPASGPGLHWATNMSLAVYIMRFRPIRYGWGRGARRYIAINRGNIDSPALMRCRLRP